MVGVLMSNVDDAHQLKYVMALRMLDVPLVATGFRRAEYYRSAAPAPGPVVLGTLSNGRHLGRLLPYVRAVPRLRRRLQGARTVLAFSSELVLLARLATVGRSTSVVREVADLPRACDARGLRGYVARLLERSALRTSSCVVSTSERYRRFVAEQLRYSGPVVVLENKPLLPPSSRAVKEPPVPKDATSLRILYPGLLRCEATLEVLAALVHVSPRTAVEVRGYSLSPAADAVGDTPFIWGGPYRSPEDLPTIYGSCDVVYSGYPYEPIRANYSRARTNRFFEAVHFGRPQIAHAGTADAEEVARREMGIVIDPSDPKAAAAAIAEVPFDDWHRFATNAAHYGRSLTPFVEDARSALRTIAAMVPE